MYKLLVSNIDMVLDVTYGLIHTYLLDGLIIKAGFLEPLVVDYEII